MKTCNDSHLAFRINETSSTGGQKNQAIELDLLTNFFKLILNSSYWKTLHGVLICAPLLDLGVRFWHRKFHRKKMGHAI